VSWGIAAVAVLLLAIILLLNHHRSVGALTHSSIKSIAVLPLKNLSGDATQDYLADGTTEALIGQLGPLRGYVHRLGDGIAAAHYAPAARGPSRRHGGGRYRQRAE
jgi:hypothetical protein